MKVVPLRLPPGADLRRALEAWMDAQQEQAGSVISAVGSLSVAQLRAELLQGVVLQGQALGFGGGGAALGLDQGVGFLDGGGAIAKLLRQAAIEPGIGSFGLILGLRLGLSAGWF